MPWYEVRSFVEQKPPNDGAKKAAPRRPSCRTAVRQATSQGALVCAIGSNGLCSLNQRPPSYGVFAIDLWASWHRSLVIHLIYNRELPNSRLIFNSQCPIYLTILQFTIYNLLPFLSILNPQFSILNPQFSISRSEICKQILAISLTYSYLCTRLCKEENKTTVTVTC